MELFDIRLPDGSLTGQVKEREAVHRDGDLHGTVHIWLWRENEKGGIDLLLQKRAANKDSYPNCYDISSAGHVDAGFDFPESAVRELSEELGVSVTETDLRFIGYQREDEDTEFYGKPFRNHEINALYLYRCDLAESAFSLQQSEVQAVLWMDADEILSRMQDESFLHCLHEEEIKRVIAAIRA